jgi:hypothetical protein
MKGLRGTAEKEKSALQASPGLNLSLSLSLSRSLSLSL